MTDIAFPDEWLRRSLEGILTPERLDEIRAKAEPNRTLWETLVAQSVVSDEQILDALSTRFRLKICDLAQLDAKVKDGITEALASSYSILPLRITDSFLEVATANPFDLDAEKALAFATAREVRTLLLAPSRISDKLDELYRPEKAAAKLLQGMETPAALAALAEAPAPTALSTSQPPA